LDLFGHHPKKNIPQYSPMKCIKEYLRKQNLKEGYLKQDLRGEGENEEKLKLLKGLPKNLRKEDKFVFT